MDLKHKTSQILLAYWNKVRGNRTTPRRFEIEPARIASILPSTFILERIDAEAYRFRLAGTNVCDIFGTELRGTNFLDGWSAMDRLALIRHLAALAKQGAVERIHMEAAPVARASTPFEVLLLPLRHTGDDIDRVLGALVPLDPPHWLGELPLTSKRIIAHELVWPGGAPTIVDEGRVRNDVPVLLPADHARIVRSERRQFRVFEGGLGRADLDKS
ncbi:MAG: PAS domain-containing protein [Hyphomicrobium sp.]|uniref:PAS domain-containing protein n=1 Tax=Hyphomicrobium sp. TaxID=82 RepID=UPI001329521E|nr:PAS domain-containing protein [Hyphomicrobium sp.]KAB2939524.1 MAG: PAS domain-containing protein [Hyphomicrobium sp.]MBZ0210087.1 PAS domain-containing protein [Hyphomicrobium sp.]MCZ7593544.1 PAS domain-containing protein [Hyphomicrobium sp.]